MQQYQHHLILYGIGIDSIGIVATPRIVDNAEDYYSAESLTSILMCISVYNRETYDEASGKNYAHRDMVINPEFKIPSYTCEHVLDALKLVFDIEQYH
jgi:hypothetical protein